MAWNQHIKKVTGLFGFVGLFCSFFHSSSTVKMAFSYDPLKKALLPGVLREAYHTHLRKMTAFHTNGKKSRAQKKEES